MRAAVDPVVSLSTHSLFPMVSFVDHVDHSASIPMVSFVDHVDHSASSASEVVDDDEAPDSSEPEMGRRGSRVADGEVYKG